MANNRTLTTANAVIHLLVPGLYDAPRKLDGFSADNIFEASAIDVSETSRGIDGRLSAGLVLLEHPFTITFQADSLSNDLFMTWHQVMKANLEVMPCALTVLLKATGKRYAMTRGFLKNLSTMPTGAKTLQPKAYSITFEDIEEVTV